MPSARLVSRLSKLMDSVSLTRENQSGRSAFGRSAGIEQSTLGELMELAEKEHAEACFVMGDVFRSGWLGAVANIEQSSRYYMTAALQDHAGAQYRLGEIANEDILEVADPVKAYFWFGLALKGGHVDAEQALYRTARTMSARDVETAVALIEAWPKIKATDGRHLHYYRGLVR